MKKIVSVFLSVMIGSNAWGQNGENVIKIELKPINTVFNKLDELFKKYFIYQMNGIDYAMGESNDLQLDMGNKTTSFKGQLNKTLTKEDFVINAGGKLLQKDPTLLHFNSNKGTTNGCRISIANHFLLASFEVDGKTFMLEQVQNFVKGADRDLIVCYATEDEIKQDVKCGNQEQAAAPHTAQAEVANRTTGICRVIDYAIAVDYSSYQWHNSSIEQTTNYILGIMNLVEGNYIGSFTDDLYYKVSEIVIFTSTATNPWVYTSDIYSVLDNFTSWASSGFSKPFDDASYWFRVAGFSSGTIGLAWLGTTCQNTNNTNAIMNFGSADYQRCLVAHEIGHNFGCQHTTGFIMNPSVGSYTTWAPESITSVNSRIYGTGGACITTCNYTDCEKTLTPSVAVIDNGSQLVVSWAANSNATKVEYRMATTGAFTTVGNFNSPTSSTTISHNPTCGVTEYFQIRISSICLNSNSGVPTIVVWQSVGGIPPTPSITIVTNNTSVCVGALATFTATAIATGNAPIYQWKVNNVNVGINSPTYSSVNLNNMDVVTCVLTSSLSCLASNNMASNAITISILQPVANFNYSKNALSVSFSNYSTCGILYLWDFGDGTTSTQTNPTHTYTTKGRFGVCLTATNGTSTNQQCIQIPVFNSWVDNLNGVTEGTPNFIMYQNGLCDKAAEFKFNSATNPQLNSSNEYLFKNYIPAKGTIEFLVNITGGYTNTGLSGTSGTLFQIGNGCCGTDIKCKLVVSSGGTINLSGWAGGFFNNKSVTGTPFRFNEWHVVSFSYGSQGYKIAVDGIVYGGNSITLNAMDSANAQLGEFWYSNSSLWQGVTGLVDKVRFSYSEADFTLNSICPTYTFNGNGNWSNAANWAGGTKPPLNLPEGSIIVIDPVANGECFLDVNQSILSTATLKIASGKKFRVPGNVNIQ